jgi:hypothetical protein
MLHLFVQGGDSHYSMRCELDRTAPGPCVLQSPVVDGSPDMGFCCIELEASSNNVILQLTVTSGDITLVTHTATLQLVANTFSGTTCVAVPTTSNTLYSVQLSANSYLTSPSSAEQAEVLSIYLNSEDAGKVG